MNPGGGCLSRLSFDRLLADERVGLDEARVHLAGCAHCQAKLAALQAERSLRLHDDAIRRGVDRVLAAARPATRRWWPLLWAPSLAVLTIFVALRFGGAPGQDDVVRVKGGPGFQVWVLLGGEARPLGAADRLAPGSRLGFRVTTEVPRVVLIAGVSEAGPSYLVDSDGTGPWSVAVGPAQTLPVSVELDRQPGAERLAAFFCAERPRADEALRALERAYPIVAGKRDLAADAAPSLPGCVVRSTLVRRNPGP